MNFKSLLIRGVIIFIICPALLGISVIVYGMPWPIEPQNKIHPIGNSFGEYQDYSEKPHYFHTGVDIRVNDPKGPNILCSVKGTISKIHLDPTPHYTYVWMKGSDGRDYWYVHIDPNEIPTSVKDAEGTDTIIKVGEKLGKVAEWPKSSGSFHHLHFQIRDDKGYINPLRELNPNNDSGKPEIVNIYICQNNSDKYIHKPITGDWVISGDVDIIAEIKDTFQPGGDNIGIYKVEYSIDEVGGSHDISPIVLWQFDRLPNDIYPNNPETLKVYKDDKTCDSNSEYWGTERYYYIVTNKFEGKLDEVNGFWDTDGLDKDGNRKFPPGYYDVTVTAYDLSGNSASKTDRVFVGPLYVDVVLVIDRSGSMWGSKIVSAKNSAKMFVDLMQVNDCLLYTSPSPRD